MTIEQRMDQLEKRNKRLTVGLTMMAVAMCAVVTMAATGDKDGTFDTVTALDVKAGHGYFDTITAERIVVKNDEGDIQMLMAAPAGYSGGDLRIENKTGETVIRLSVDDYGNGVVWAGNRKGMGRELKPGP
jgi:hypothetical protein